jgi:hypothetical protein
VPVEPRDKPAEVPVRRVVQPPVKVVKKAPAPAQGPQGQFGTSVQFVNNPLAANRQADKNGKLRFVLHVSGNFEDPGCT